MTLFFTEMWERLSYYGMRSFLVLFMAAPAATGGLGMAVARAARVYGIYTASVYISSLPGGWIADRFLGLRKAVLIGGAIIAAGHFMLAIPGETTVYVGLALVVIGTGLLKPNISAMVGELYRENDPRRDSGYSIYYMGINLGAFLAPLICGTLAQRVGWHWGFGAAGVGMAFGLIQYVLTGHHLGNAGLAVKKRDTEKSGSSVKGMLWFGGLGLICVALGVDMSSLQKLVVLAAGSTMFIVSLYWGEGFTAVEKKRGLSIYFFFWVAALFWSGFEQAGSSLNLFADRLTDNRVFGFEFPSTWYQSLNPLYIITLAPLLAALWIKLGDKQPSSPTKFNYGLLGVGLGLVVMVPAAAYTNGGETLVSPWWLTVTYLLHTMGELCLSPVGLSLMTKLAPARIVGQIMGVWFLASAVGNYMSGEVASLFEELPLTQIFGGAAGVTLGVALIVALSTKKISEQMGGVR